MFFFGCIIRNKNETLQFGENDYRQLSSFNNFSLRRITFFFFGICINKNFHVKIYL